LLRDDAVLFSRRSTTKGDVLLSQGERWSDAWLIEQGLIRLCFVRRDGREFNKNFFSDGALVCPITPAMYAEPSLFAVVACESGSVWHADAGKMRDVLARGNVWEALQRELLTRLVSHKLQREHDLLALDGTARYLAFRRRFPTLAARVPLAHLATYLGLTDVSLHGSDALCNLNKSKGVHPLPHNRLRRPLLLPAP
jgi:CRP-like cAMP-binding protein